MIPHLTYPWTIVIGACDGIRHIFSVALTAGGYGCVPIVRNRNQLRQNARVTALSEAKYKAGPRINRFLQSAGKSTVLLRRRAKSPVRGPSLSSCRIDMGIMKQFVTGTTEA